MARAKGIDSGRDNSFIIGSVLGLLELHPEFMNTNPIMTSRVSNVEVLGPVYFQVGIFSTPTPFAKVLVK